MIGLIEKISELKMQAIKEQIQIQRIQLKLVRAKEADAQLKVFGANSHLYNLNEKASEKEILAFEQQYGIALPSDYRMFLKEVGNGGAGPDYGIYPLGERLDEFSFNDEFSSLSRPCILNPKMDEDVLAQLNHYFDSEDEVSEALFFEEEAILWGGILPIGTPGCTGGHGLILNGEYAGFVIHVNLIRDWPLFHFYLPFLDWYENWLDKVISGELIRGGPMGNHAENIENEMQCPAISTESQVQKKHVQFKKCWFQFWK